MDILDELSAFEEFAAQSPLLTWEIAETLRDDISMALLKLREKHTHWLNVRFDTETEYRLVCAYSQILTQFNLPQELANDLRIFSKKLTKIIIHAGEIEEGTTLDKPLKKHPSDSNPRREPALIDPEHTTSSLEPDNLSTHDHTAPEDSEAPFVLHAV